MLRTICCLRTSLLWGKKAVVTLIEKKDKDRRLIKNWRPTSLLIVDVKIELNVIAKEWKRYCNMSFIMIKMPLSRDKVYLTNFEQ